MSSAEKANNYRLSASELVLDRCSRPRFPDYSGRSLDISEGIEAVSAFSISPCYTA